MTSKLIFIIGLALLIGCARTPPPADQPDVFSHGCVDLPDDPAALAPWFMKVNESGAFYQVADEWVPPCAKGTTVEVRYG